jgi:pimeloyl-ACP methyl ester carboxylesterase
LLSGEYDCSCTPEKTIETSKRIRGSKYKIIPGIGHFPMSENPKLFFKYLKPILKEIIS